MSGYLTVILFFPLLGAALLVGIPGTNRTAIRQATLGMTALLQRRLGLSHTDAVMVAGAAVDIRLGQAANFGVKVSAYAACPKTIFAGRGGAGG